MACFEAGKICPIIVDKRHKKAIVRFYLKKVLQKHEWTNLFKDSLGCVILEFNFLKVDMAYNLETIFIVNTD